MASTFKTSIERTSPLHDAIGIGSDSVGIELSILMPCLNEAETIAFCIEKALRFLSDNRIRGEIVIADNGSTDGSRRIAESYGVRIIDVPTRGYGSALAAGISAALKAPEMKPKLAKQGLFPVGTCGAEFGAYLRKQVDEYGRIIAEANIKPE